MKNFKQKEITAVNHSSKLSKIPSVAEYMTKKLITFRENTSLESVIKELLSNKITGAPVLDEHGTILGVIDDKDCLKLITERLYHNAPASSKTAKDYMSDMFKVIPSSMNIVDIANLFMTTPFKRFLIINENKDLVGQVSRTDILKAVLDWN